MSTPPVTLKELAARARVHPSTISRVVNHAPGLRIAAPTRARIEALLQQTQYRPNSIARSLKLRQTFVVAVVIPDVTNPLFAAVYRGVEDTAGRRGYNVILCNTDGSPERADAHLQVLQARRVDGVILASSTLRDPSIRWLRQQGIPHVLVNRFSEWSDAFVGGDDFAGGKLATDHLVALGHRRIGHLAGPLTVSTAVERRRGYLAALEEAGRPADPHLVAESGFLEDGGESAAARLFARAYPPTALFAVNDLAALGAYAAARRRGMRIPDDLAVVGYNDIPLARWLAPGLTTMRVPAHPFGTAAAEMLIAQIESSRRELERVVFTPELVVRGSTQAAD